MTQYYKGARVAGSQRLDEAGNPIGPRYKGLPGEFIEVHPELAWMIEADRPEAQTFGSEEGEFVWVLEEAWDSWRSRVVD